MDRVDFQTKTKLHCSRQNCMILICGSAETYLVHWGVVDRRIQRRRGWRRGRANNREQPAWGEILSTALKRRGEGRTDSISSYPVSLVRRFSRSFDGRAELGSSCRCLGEIAGMRGGGVLQQFVERERIRIRRQQPHSSPAPSRELSFVYFRPTSPTSIRRGNGRQLRPAFPAYTPIIHQRLQSRFERNFARSRPHHLETGGDSRGRR